MRYVVFIALFISIGLNIFFFAHTWADFTVTSVPDGDSLQLASGQRIRLLGIDAPERDMCMAADARETLEQAVKGRHVRLKDTITDDYGRTLANVFTKNVHLNHLLVSNGLAKYIYVKSPYSDTLKAAQSLAKENKLGIWSETCRKTSNPECAIKGNTRAGKKTYLLPDCKNYDQTIIDTAFSDRWFCSEKEAIAAGFTKASGCP